MTKKRWLPQWVSSYTDKNGKKRYRFRRTGYTTYYFKHEPGSVEFAAEYKSCKDGVAAQALRPGMDRIVPGSFDDLISRYYRSPDFLDPGDRTRVVYRNAIERWREMKTPKGNRHGAAMVKDLDAKLVGGWMADMLPHKTSANMLRKRLSALMDFAVREGMAPTNPVKATKAFKITSGGVHAWTEREISAYEKRHKLGTKARLAFDLLLWTGQRRGDMRMMGPGNVVDGRLSLVQEKTGMLVDLPILQPLADSILASPIGAETFLVNEWGNTFTSAGIGNWFRNRCDEAALPQCSAHGLRKAAARRFAEAGCTNQQIKSWTGHTTDSEVSRYTASASRQALSDDAGVMLMASLARLAKKQSDN